MAGFPLFLELGALDVEGGQDLVEPARDPPRGAAGEEHRCGHERHANAERVEEDAGGEREAEDFDERQRLANERHEDGDHDDGSGGDDAGALGEAHDGGFLNGVVFPVEGLRAAGIADEVLAHAGDDEDLIVHRQAEGHADEEDRHKRDERARRGDEAGEPVLPDEDRDAEGRADGEQEAQAGDERNEQRTEHDEQQENGEADDDGQVRQHGGLEALGDVELDGGKAGHADVGASGVRDFLGGGAQGLGRAFGTRVRRRGLGRDHDLRGGAFTVEAHELRVLHAAHLVELRSGVEEGTQRRLVLVRAVGLRRHVRCERCGIRVGVLTVNDDEEGAVDAGAEAFGHKVGRLALRRVWVRGRIGGQRELHVEHRRGERAEAEDHDGHDKARHALDEAHPAAAHSLAVADLAATRGVTGDARDAAGEGPLPEQAE